MTHTAKKQLLLLGVTCLLLSLFVEAGARLVYFVKEGFNPYFLKFGFVPDLEFHSAEHDGYTKFQPNSVYHQKIDSALTISMKINSDGFRNLYDFTRPKPPGVFRIVSLGESSTFGYYDEDEETYPYLLEQMLRRTYPDLQIEVLNLGIPHIRMENVVALARHELARLEPDVVTLYAGYNNSAVLRPPEQASLPYRIKDWLYFHSVAWRAIHPMVVVLYYRLAQTLNMDMLDTPNLGLPVALDEERINQLRKQIVQEYAARLEELADIVQGIGAQFVPITQTYTPFKKSDRPTVNGQWRTYDGEVDYVEGLLHGSGKLLAPYSTLIIHRDLMDKLRTIARRRNLPLVEGIAALDQDRGRMMATFVHLTRTGNSRLAAAIHDTMVATTMTSRPSPPTSPVAQRFTGIQVAD